MVTRDEVLRELGLAPVWRLRRTPWDDALAPADRTIAVPLTEPTSVREPMGTRLDERCARIASLAFDALVDDIAGCRACVLCTTRSRTVPGVGSVNAQWMFVGEAPGADEDAQGEPFVGAAGQLLDNMLAALRLSRGVDVFIANVLKCRPPNNRTPDRLEAAACRPYLDRQIELVAPRLIVALGKSAACVLLDVDASVASLRRRVHRYRGTPLIVTYHPAYLLRSPADKAKAWEDLLFARRTLRELASGTG
ncbi:MAG: uracil-DNA glycosylase [Casimicrobiaceae bacterium]